MKANKCLVCDNKDDLIEVSDEIYLCKKCSKELGTEIVDIKNDLLDFFREQYDIEDITTIVIILDSVSKILKFDNDLLDEDEKKEIAYEVKRIKANE